MPYVGNIPAENYAAFNVQHFTTSATTSYTLDHAVANELDIRLVINNVIQQPGAGKAYTATGTTLTLSAATSGTDTMYCVYTGKAVQTVVPPAGSVDLTSTVTGTLPIANGGTGSTSTTFVNAATNITGVVPTANLGSGTASSSTVLYGDQTYKTAPSGGLTFLQTASGSSTASVAFTGWISATYRYYKVYYEATPTANADCMFTFYKSSGAISGSNFDYGHAGLNDAGNSETSYGNNQSAVQVGHGLKNNTEIDDPSIVGCLQLINPANTSNTTLMLNQFSTRNSSGDFRSYSGGILYEDQPALTGFALSFASGNVHSAKLTAYGMKDS